MSDTQKIKDNLDIVDFINDYVKLKAAGSSHKGLCPFHSEKSPSFMVNRDRQSWYCFGCNKGGDVFSFFQEIEGLEFIEALKILADKAGVTLERRSGVQSKEQASEKARLRDVMTDAASFYHNFLTKMDASKAAKEYLYGRGFTDETINHWQIGFIPEQWELLTKYLTKKGHSIDDLVTAGLTMKRDAGGAQQRYYDRFRGRIMFPIRDIHGSVVAFTGRVLVEHEKSGGKYVNSPQTPLFDKSRTVFGLDKSKQEMKKNDVCVLMEGQLDVIAAHQAGMPYAVASSGTALTEHHVKLIKRYTKNISFAFDADEAGQKAAKRGIDIAIEQGMSAKVIQIPEGAGKDPDECIQKDKAVWFQAVEQAVDIMNWYVQRAFAGKDLGNPKDKQEIANALVPELARIPFAIEQDHWVKKIATSLDTEAHVLRTELQKYVANQKEPVQTTTLSSAPEVEKKEKKADQTSPGVYNSAQLSKLDQLLERFLLLTLQNKSFDVSEYLDRLADPFADSEIFAPLYESIKIGYSMGTIFDPAQSTIKSVDESILNILLLKADEEFSAMSAEKRKQQAQWLEHNILEEYKKHQRILLATKIRQAEASGDREAVTALLQTFRSL